MGHFGPKCAKLFLTFVVNFIATEDLCCTKVSNLNVHICIQKNIFRFEVPANNHILNYCWRLFIQPLELFTTFTWTNSHTAGCKEIDFPQKWHCCQYFFLENQRIGGSISFLFFHWFQFTVPAHRQAFQLGMRNLDHI